jgi:hypothetical protein
MVVAGCTGGATPAAGPTHASPPQRSKLVVANVGAPSFAYAGAWSSPLYGLQIAPAGTASARVQRTGTLGMTVLGKGQRYQVTVDFKHRAIRTIRTCSCLLNVTLVTGLTPSPHIVWVTNVSNRYLAMRNWFADKGAIFRQVFAPNSALASVIDSSHPMTFFVTGASTVAVDYEAARTMLHVRINDAVVPYDVRTSARSSEPPWRGAFPAGSPRSS